MGVSICVKAEFMEISRHQNTAQNEYYSIYNSKQLYFKIRNNAAHIGK